MLTLDQLNQKVQWINQAPADLGVLHTLCVRPEEGKRHYPQEMAFSCEEGVIGDRWIRKTWIYLEDGSPDPRLQVCILQKRVLDLVWVDRENTPYPADNLIVDMNLSEQNLPVGSRLQAGTSILEVSDVFNTACAKWRDRYGIESIRWINLPENRQHRLRGILCKVVQDGCVTLDDKLRKVS